MISSVKSFSNVSKLVCSAELDSVKVLGLAAVRKLSQIDPSLVPFALKLAHKVESR